VRKRPLARCRLCLEERLLCDSHLIPAAALSLLHSPNLKNPHPVQLGETDALRTSKQLKDYLLCEECEARFRVNGEDWVLANCWRSKQEFRIREALLRNKPFAVGSTGVAAYKASEIPEIDTDRLIYFGLSIFWRASVHTWRTGKRIVHLELGRYSEALRLFLFDKQFPQHMLFVVRVSGVEEYMPVVSDPDSKKGEGHHVHQFSIPDLTFTLAVGQKIPDPRNRYCTAPSPERYIGISPRSDEHQLRRIASRLQDAQARGFQLLEA
jgi:hypothetical protein